MVCEMNDRVPHGLKEWERYVVDTYFPHEGKVLNVGCGCGREAIALAELGYDLYVVDVTEAQLQVATANARDAGVQIEFALSDGLAVPFKEQRFDAVVIWTQVLGNMEERSERRKLLESCRETMDTRGVISASFHDHAFCAKTWPQDVDGRWLYPWGKGHLRYRLFAADEVNELLTESGFAVTETAIRDSLQAVIFTVAFTEAD